MTVAIIHQNSFVMNVEWSVKISCGTCTSFIFNSKLILFFKEKIFKKLFALFLQIHEHLTRASHPYFQRETMKKWSKGMMK